MNNGNKFIEIIKEDNKIKLKRTIEIIVEGKTILK